MLYRNHPKIFSRLCVLFLVLGIFLHGASVFYCFAAFIDNDYHVFFLASGIAGIFLPVVFEIILAVSLLFFKEAMFLACFLLGYIVIAACFIWFVFRPFELWYYSPDTASDFYDFYDSYDFEIFHCYDWILHYITNQTKIFAVVIGVILIANFFFFMSNLPHKPT